MSSLDYTQIFKDTSITLSIMIANDIVMTVFPSLPIDRESIDDYEMIECAFISPNNKRGYKKIPAYEFYVEHDIKMQALNLKRMGNLVKANEVLCNHIQSHRFVTTDMIKSWYKIIASSGLLAHAIAVTLLCFPAEYETNMLDQKIFSDQCFRDIMQHSQLLFNLVEQQNIPELMTYLKSISGQQNYSLQPEELAARWPHVNSAETLMSGAQNVIEGSRTTANIISISKNCNHNR